VQGLVGPNGAQAIQTLLAVRTVVRQHAA
jgi:hypothetical protein